MKVLFLTASYPTAEAPALGIFVKEHARAVAPHADVAVVHLDRSEDVRWVTVEQTPGEEFPTWRVRYPYSPAPVSYAANVAAAVAGLRRARRAGFDPDLIHAHFFLAGIPAVLIGGVLRRPVVITEQWSVFLPEDPATLSPFVRRTARFAFERADRVLPVSRALEAGIRRVAPRARCTVVPNVYDEHLFRPPGEVGHDGARRLVSIGANYEAKGWDYLLDALALLRERRTDFHLNVAGPSDWSSCEDVARRLGIESLVSFRGYLPKEDVAELLRTSDLYVLTSRYDSNPCSLIEALATGLPAVGTAVGGVPEMITPGSGLLAEPRDPASVAARLDEALDRLGTFDRAAIAAAARERYGKEEVGRRFADVYAEVARR